jgi:hypothetical protein
VDARIRAAQEDQIQRQGALVASSLVTAVRIKARGRPRKHINLDYLQFALNSGPSTHIASLLDVSTITIRRRALESGIRQPGQAVTVYSRNSEGELTRSYPGRRGPRNPAVSEETIDSVMSQALSQFPNIGGNMLIGHFRSLGHTFTRDQLRESFKRVNGPPAEFGQRRIQRRTYKVAGPNALWHNDGHHSQYLFRIWTRF